MNIAQHEIALPNFKVTEVADLLYCDYRKKNKNCRTYILG